MMIETVVTIHHEAKKAQARLWPKQKTINRDTQILKVPAQGTIGFQCEAKKDNQFRLVLVEQKLPAREKARKSDQMQIQSVLNPSESLVQWREVSSAY